MNKHVPLSIKAILPVKLVFVKGLQPRLGVDVPSFTIATEPVMDVVVILGPKLAVLVSNSPRALAGAVTVTNFSPSLVQTNICIRPILPSGAGEKFALFVLGVVALAPSCASALT